MADNDRGQSLITKYVWVIETIYRRRKISFKELNELWLRDDISRGVDIPKRTFDNWRYVIWDMFGISIVNENRGEYRYYIENEEDISKNGLRSWLYNTFCVSNALANSQSIKDRIILEYVPSGQNYLQPIIEAMKENRVLNMTYHSYWKDEENNFDVQPYCVKLFRQRWYMVARSTYSYYYEKGPRIYALDRINALRMTDETFEMPKDWTAKDFFDGCFGIIADQRLEPQTVKLKVSNVTYRALLIGQTYRSTGYSTLVGDRDVSLLKAALKKGKGPKGGKYKVTTKTDLSYSGIQSAIEETFANADADDVSLFYFSGHGDASSYSFGAGALVTVEDFGTDWVDLLTLSLWLRCVPGKVIVFIDSCGSGAAIYGSGRSSANAAAEAARFNQAVIDAFAAADMTIVNGDAENTGDFRESKFCVLTSSGYREDSYVYRFKEGKYSLFTYYAARGCKGAADKNGDKYITLNELYKYIHKNEGSRQHVQLYPSKSSYKLTKVS